MLDAAVVRPGRLDKHIYVHPPGEEDLKAILEDGMAKLGVEIADIEECIEIVLRKARNYTCSDINSLVYNAFLSGVKKASEEGTEVKLDKSDFEAALLEVKGSLGDVSKFEGGINQRRDQVGVKSTFA